MITITFAIYSINKNQNLKKILIKLIFVIIKREKLREKVN